MTFQQPFFPQKEGGESVDILSILMYNKRVCGFGNINAKFALFLNELLIFRKENWRIRQTSFRLSFHSYFTFFHSLNPSRERE